MSKKFIDIPPCCKCGGVTWSGPKYSSFANKLTYMCTTCQYMLFLPPKDVN